MGLATMSRNNAMVTIMMIIIIMVSVFRGFFGKAKQSASRGYKGDGGDAHGHNMVRPTGRVSVLLRNPQNKASQHHDERAHERAYNAEKWPLTRQQKRASMRGHKTHRDHAYGARGVARLVVAQRQGPHCASARRAQFVSDAVGDK